MRKQIQRIMVALWVGLFALTSAPAMANDGNSYAEHTPGFRLMGEAARFYQMGWYFSARNRYYAAAGWADKLAQFNVGVMYLHGQGVDQDQARGLAWLMLASERGYPDMVNAVEQAKLALGEDQVRRAKGIYHNELLPQYGDEIAIERTAQRMERNRRRATGSRTGFVGHITVIDASGQSRSGEDFYAKEKWDFHRIVALETEMFESLAGSTVTLGEFEVIEDSD